MLQLGARLLQLSLPLLVCVCHALAATLPPLASLPPLVSLAVRGREQQGDRELEEGGEEAKRRGYVCAGRRKGGQGHVQIL